MRRQYLSYALSCLGTNVGRTHFLPLIGRRALRWISELLKKTYIKEGSILPWTLPVPKLEFL